MHRSLRAIIASVLVGGVAACGGGSSPAPPQSIAPVTSPASLATATASFGAAPIAAPGRVRLQPSSGAYFGLNLDWANETVAQASESLGRTPAVWVQFTTFPLDDAARANVDDFIDQVAAVGGMGLLTLEPHDGLDAVTDAAAADLGDLLARAWTDHGVPMFVRFAHEMNGSWYAWSQQPEAYVKAFKRVAAAVHERSPSSAMIWAPNQGGGYPFTGGRYAAAPGSADAAVLDSNGDGTLDAKDDPYAPFFPGDEAVDWIGVSLYHWGLAYPWGENELPRPGTFEKLIRGEDTGAHEGGATIPDLYATYADGHDKPMAIIETAILFDPAATGGPSEKDLKSAWFGQVFSDATRTGFPRLGMLNWFEWRKQESEVGRVIDWRLASDPALA
ncbi:MAG TPA: glycosyl hydrolase, partial [Candidatus Limnocylindrales bacterium]|nr:glycosyl hydrolase [Candidatus Limnocylindrales bacterium]